MAPGSEFHLGLDLITADINVKNQVTGESVSSNNRSNNRGPYLALEADYTYRNGALGVGAFAQGGLGTEYARAAFFPVPLAAWTPGSKTQAVCWY